jgi:putative copper export protein
MSFLLRALRLLSVVVWVGGLIFFAFVEAPTAFHVMGTTREFAQLIGGSVSTLNRLGHAAGLLFILASLLLLRRTFGRVRKLLVAQVLLVVLMIAATIYVQHGIVPAMERDRASAGGDITVVPTGSPARADFDRLHALSEKVEGAALFLGLGVVILMAAEDGRASA